MAKNTRVVHLLFADGNEEYIPQIRGFGGIWLCLYRGYGFGYYYTWWYLLCHEMGCYPVRAKTFEQAHCVLENFLMRKKRRVIKMKEVQ